MMRLMLRPSRGFAAVLAVAHAAAAVCAILVLPWTGALVAACVLVASLRWHCRRDALLLAADAAEALALDSDGRCEVRLRDGTELEGWIRPSSFVSALVTVVNVRLDGGRRRAFVLVADSADAEDLRRLRVWLRHGLHASEGRSAGL